MVRINKSLTLVIIVLTLTGCTQLNINKVLPTIFESYDSHPSKGQSYVGISPISSLLNNWVFSNDQGYFGNPACRQAKNPGENVNHLYCESLITKWGGVNEDGVIQETINAKFDYTLNLINSETVTLNCFTDEIPELFKPECELKKSGPEKLSSVYNPLTKRVEIVLEESYAPINITTYTYELISSIFTEESK